MRGNQPIKKLVASAAIVGAFIFYSLLHGHASPAASAPQSSTDTSAGATSNSSTSSSSSGTTPAAGTTSTPSGRYKDGSYTGSVADAQWGYVQVKAIIKNGKITDVQWLQYPSDRSRSQYINGIADPELTSEAIQAQSAQVDAITGATDSSVAFMQSLSDALSQAQA
jgi:uncharacterized protein with FMN-binding domain